MSGPDFTLRSAGAEGREAVNSWEVEECVRGSIPDSWVHSDSAHETKPEILDLRPVG